MCNLNGFQELEDFLLVKPAFLYLGRQDTVQQVSCMVLLPPSSFIFLVEGVPSQKGHVSETLTHMCRGQAAAA